MTSVIAARDTAPRPPRRQRQVHARPCQHAVIRDRSGERADSLREGVRGGSERHDRAERPPVLRQAHPCVDSRPAATLPGLMKSAITVHSTKIRTATAQISTASTFELAELPLLAMFCTASR